MKPKIGVFLAILIPMILFLVLVITMAKPFESPWNACEDALKRRESASTDTIFRYAQRDAELFCPKSQVRNGSPTATPCGTSDKACILRRILTTTVTPTAYPHP